MTEIAIGLLSEHPGSVEAARDVLATYLRLPDAWERHGGVPEVLPRFFGDEIAAFPGAARPPTGDVVIGTVDRKVVAAGHIVPAGSGACEFKRVLVGARHRRHGLGASLADAMIARATALGYGRVLIDVMPERGGAISFWTRAGFEPTDPYRDYPFAMVFMERRLDAPA